MVKGRKGINKGNLGRKKPSREENKKFLIVCEDSKSVLCYLKKLREYYSIRKVNIAIETNRSKSAPHNLVECIKRKLDNREFDFDKVYCIFDRDDHSTYDEALQSIENLNKQDKPNIKTYAITSNPCFELWYLLHFKYNTRSFSDCGELIKELKKEPEFNDYRKGDKDCNFFEKIQSKIQRAIENSKKLSKDKDILGKKHHRNPTTYVYKLVECFEKISEDQI